MTILGYFNGNLTEEQRLAFEEKNVTSFLIDLSDEDETTFKGSLDQMVNYLSSGDQLVIYNLSNLKRTLAEVATLLTVLKNADVELVVLNKEELFNSMTDSEFFEFIIDLYEENQKVIQEKTRISQKNKRNVGRPRISQRKIEQIRHLRLEKKYTLQEVSKICDVSLGTVYKYTEQLDDPEPVLN